MATVEWQSCNVDRRANYHAIRAIYDPDSGKVAQLNSKMRAKMPISGLPGVGIFLAYNMFRIERNSMGYLGNVF
ncbi:MAG: hypothetical protein RIN56_15450 [Sporomusaceae bacterium]|nr:hypothetical protein [Sporomusaceae bacterium]